MKTQYDIIASGEDGSQGLSGKNGEDVLIIPLDGKNGKFTKHGHKCTPAEPGLPGVNASINGTHGHSGGNGKDAYFFSLNIDTITIETENPLQIYAKGGNGGQGGQGGNGGQGGPGGNAGIQAKKCSSSIGAEPGGSGGSGSRAGDGGPSGSAGNGGTISVIYTTATPTRNQYVKGYALGGNQIQGGDPGNQSSGGKGGLNGTQPGKPKTNAPEGPKGGTGKRGDMGAPSKGGIITIKQKQ